MSVRNAMTMTYDIVSVAFIAFVSVGILRSYSSADGSTPAAILEVGQALQLDQVDWHRAKRTLVLVLSGSNCDACEKSAAFYRTLLRHRTDWQAIAVTVDEPAAFSTYLKANHLTLDAVKRHDPKKSGLPFVPSVLVVNDRGKVDQQWLGQLSSFDEDDIAAHLDIPEWSTLSRRLRSTGELPPALGQESQLLSTAELKAALAENRGWNLIDVRDRESFATNAIRGAVNIPADELAVRLPHEMVEGEPVVLYCSFSAACAADGRPSVCSLASGELHNIGLSDFRIVRDSLRVLAAGGVAVTAGDAGRED